MSRLLRTHCLQHETIQTVQVALALHGVSGCGAAPQHAGVQLIHACVLGGRPTPANPMQRERYMHSLGSQGLAR